MTKLDEMMLIHMLLAGVHGSKEHTEKYVTLALKLLASSDIEEAYDLLVENGFNGLGVFDLQLINIDMAEVLHTLSEKDIDFVDSLGKEGLVSPELVQSYKEVAKQSYEEGLKDGSRTDVSYEDLRKSKDFDSHFKV